MCLICISSVLGIVPLLGALPATPLPWQSAMAKKGLASLFLKGASVACGRALAKHLYRLSIYAAADGRSLTCMVPSYI